MGVRCSPVSSYPLLRRAVNGQMRQTLAESFGKACKSRNILNARRAFRVAAPSIRIVPWAALASCWPLPQQLLPVSATGGGRRRCWPCSAERVFLFVVPKRLRAFRNYFFTGGGVAWNGICCKNLRFASCKKGLLRGAAAPEGYVIAAQTSKLGSSFSMWMLDIKALCSGSVNSASFTYLFSTAAVRTGSAMVPAPPMQPPGQPMPSSK